jgi:hypothetical protein
MSPPSSRSKNKPSKKLALLAKYFIAGLLLDLFFSYEAVGDA